MNIFSELYLAVQSDMNIGDESPLYNLATVKRAVNRAYVKAAGLFRWPETEDAQKTSTQEDQEYYDYPQLWRPDSIWKLEVDGVDYGNKLSLKDYLYEKENISGTTLPSGRDYIWTNQWRRFFMYPIPTVAGTNNIVVWGQTAVEDMSDDADITIWSYSMPECNEAIVLEATAMLKAQGEMEQSGQFRSLEAKQILITAWGKVQEEKDQEKSTRPEFTIPDFFA